MIDRIVGAVAQNSTSTTSSSSAAQIPNYSSVISQMAQDFVSFMNLLLGTIDSTVISIARLAYISVLLVGVLLYFTHAERRLGKDLIKGGIVLAILAEFVFPLIARA